MVTRLERLEQRMITRAEDRSAPYPYVTPSKRGLGRDDQSTERRFELTGVRHAVVDMFQGDLYVKIREYLHRKDGKLWSSPRGINLRISEWKKLVEMMTAINRAVEEFEVQEPPKKKKSRVELTKVHEGESYACRLPEDVVPDTDPEWIATIGIANGAKTDNSCKVKPKKLTLSAPEQDGTLNVERQKSEELAFNLIQTIFVPRIIRKGLKLQKVAESVEGHLPVDVNGGFYSMYVYCDVAENQLVGDVSAPLLRVVPVQTSDVAQGDVVAHSFSTPHYVPVTIKNFEVIQMDIRTDTGEKVAF
ncbi:uncharacterized protein LOC110985305 [Acanthaster planci]|uniref:Uncharacterized protein LOC110985305 n=1 Tax=Acanthaster planci TaxID=133434 RepID=A0A8B7ZAE3_ACAPL|nr:uncharacterized protein LOC110985305 [Acanthaster planci]